MRPFKDEDKRERKSIHMPSLPFQSSASSISTSLSTHPYSLPLDEEMEVDSAEEASEESQSESSEDNSMELESVDTGELTPITEYKTQAAELEHS